MPRKKKSAATPGQRPLRVGEEIRHALSHILTHEADRLDDPDLYGKSVTVTEVRISPDLSNATVFYSTLGGERMEEAQVALKRAAAFLRGQVARMVNLRHAPTLSFPVAGTLMVEPTESESKFELDRFCDAMIAIREEIRQVEQGKLPQDDNPLKNAPHTAESLLKADWAHAYSRDLAAYPVASLRKQKYWAPVGRVDNVYGDRNLFCSCVPVSDYQA